VVFTVVKKGQIRVVITVVEKGYIRVAIRMVTKGWLLGWLKVADYCGYYGG